MAMTHKLIITYVDSYVTLYDDSYWSHVWVRLETNGESRECRYTSQIDDSVWEYEGGDNEPDMDRRLLSLFHSSVGDEALQRCYDEETSVTLTVNTPDNV